MYQTLCNSVANTIREFAHHVKQIIHYSTSDYVFRVGQKSMSISSKVVGVGVLVHFK